QVGDLPRPARRDDLLRVGRGGRSFLGAGTPPVIPSWGNIMAEGRAYVQLAFWIVLFPGLFLALTVLSVNLIGDGLRDRLKVR
ncbi:MAG TPA: hypothetical protein VF406_08940, partial [Thermodesulfobacteriota bacterium]